MSNQSRQKTLPHEKSPKSSTAEADPTLDLIASIQSLLAPSLEFKKVVEDANENDIRFHWSVEIIKGKNTPFGHVTGNSTLPGLLSDGQIPMVTEKVSAEMIAKIAEPVTNMFQHLMNLRALEITADDSLPALPAPTLSAALIEEPDLAMEAEIISENDSQA
jgi:hypothetical protein